MSKKSTIDFNGMQFFLEPLSGKLRNAISAGFGGMLIFKVPSRKRRF